MADHLINIVKYKKVSYDHGSDCSGDFYTLIDNTDWVRVTDEEYYTLYHGVHLIAENGFTYQIVEKPLYNESHADYIKLTLDAIREKVAKRTAKEAKEKEDYQKKNAKRIEAQKKKAAAKKILASLTPKQLEEFAQKVNNGELA